MRNRLLAVVAAALTLPAAASAATRYASSTAVMPSPACDLAAPCPLSLTAGGAQAGDTVIVLSDGVYTTGSFAINGTGVTFQGEPGKPRPEIVYTGAAGSNFVTINGAGATIKDVIFEGTSSDPALGMVVAPPGVNPTFERVLVIGHGNTPAVIAGPNAVMRDSLVNSAGSFWGMLFAGTMTGSTIVAPNAVEAGVLAHNSYFIPANLTIRNTIVTRGSVATGNDVRVANDFVGQSAHLDIDYSSFLSTAALGTNGTQNVGPHNVGPAVLVDATPGPAQNIHQLPASPTINAGDPSVVAAGELDWEGDPRLIGSAPDIGADEAHLAPTVTTSAATGVAQTAATLNGQVTPNGAATTYRFEYGPTTTYGTSTPVTSAGSSAAATAVSANLTGLTPNTVYHARLVATNALGETAGADLTFTTPAVPVAPVVPLVVGKIGVTYPARQTTRVATLGFTISHGARVRLAVVKLVPGRKQGIRCVPTRTTGTRCVKPVASGAVNRTYAAGGRKSVVIPKRLAGRTLTAGRYRVTVTSVDPLGVTGTTRTVVITVR